MLTDAPPAALHPDRLLPTEPVARALARRLYESVRSAPIVAPHGHVDAALIAADARFSDPASLLVTTDHYVTRLLHANGVPLDRLRLGAQSLDEPAARDVWRLLCSNWHVFRGTPVRYWFASELAETFGISERPCAANADALYDIIAARLELDEFRPRALFEQFGIDVLATTDDPCDDLASHRQLAEDPTFRARVIPAFRPDTYLEPARAGWPAAVRRLGAVADVDTGDLSGFIEALEERRRYFIEHGATSADHSHADARTEPLDRPDAEQIYTRALRGEATGVETTALRRHMLLEMARMSVDDGLVMTLHPYVSRNHHRSTFDRFGPDTGHDIPVRAEYTHALGPLLERFGTEPGFHLVLYTLDETLYSREIAPLAGFYPSVLIGAPWWFLDAPTAIRRFYASVTETAGFTRMSGFVDDTRAFCSIPARHDMSRRLDSGVLARLVTEHQLDEDEAFETVRDLVVTNPRRAFKL